jgi:hypothetical protein
VILVIMYVDIFETSVIVFISDVKMCLITQTDIFQYRSQLRTDLIFLWIKVSSVIQTISAAHINPGKMSNLQINSFFQLDLYFSYKVSVYT